MCSVTELVVLFFGQITVIVLIIISVLEAHSAVVFCVFAASLTKLLLVGK